MRARETMERVLSLGEDVPFFPQDAYEDRRRPFALRVGALVVLAFAAHFMALGVGWIWLDQTRIVDNILLRSLRGLPLIWLHPLASEVGPLANSLLYLEYLAFGPGPAGYHFINLLLHTGSALVLWLILRRLGVAGAWLAAAVFAVHPIEVQSVAWASRQADLLAGMLGLLAFHAHLNLLEIHPPVPADYVLEPPNARRMLIWSVTLFACAVLCKPAALTLPLVLLLVIWWKRGTVLRHELMRLAPHLGIMLIFGVMLVGASELHHEGGPAGALNPFDRIVMTASAACFYFRQILIPFNLLMVYDRWHVTGDLWMAVFPVGLVLLAYALSYASRWFGKGPLVALLAFLALLLPQPPMIRSEWMSYGLVADHLQYLAGIPLIALMVAAVMGGIERLTRGQEPRLARLLAGAVAIGGLGTLAWMQTTLYASESRLWRDAIAHQSFAVIARAQLSQIDLSNAKLAAAAELFTPTIVQSMNEQAARPGPDAGAMVIPLLAWGKVLDSEGRFSEAISVYQRVVAIDPRSHEASTRLATAYRDRGDADKALASFQEAVSHYPRDESLQNSLGQALMERGETGNAIEHFRAAIGLNANFIPARLNLSGALFAQNKLPEAAEQLQKVFQIDPRNFEALMTSGIMLARLHDFPRSERMLKAAIQLRPDSAEAHNNLGIALAAQGFLNEAVDHFDTALKLRPDFDAAKRNMDKALAERDAKKAK